MSYVTDDEWTEFKTKFNKVYKDDAEELMRRQLYTKSKLKIEEHNRKYEAGEVTWKMGMNHLADATEEEFAMRCGKKMGPPTAI